MSDGDDGNCGITDELREDGGDIGRPFEAAPLLLLHGTGARRPGRVSPMTYQAVEGGDVFASKAGAPTNPDRYHSSMADPRATIEGGTDAVEVTARVADGDERDGIWSTQKAGYPGLAGYEQKTTRQTPVVVRTPTG